MGQEKRFGKRVAIPSTAQIIRELKLLMRHDAEVAATGAFHAAGVDADGVALVLAGTPSRSDAP